MAYNILYLHNKSEISGGERSLLSLWANLDRQTFKAFLIVPKEGEFSRQARALGVVVIFLAFPQLRPWNAVAISHRLRAFKKILREHEIHLIHSHTARNNILGACAGRAMRIPVIWHERNVLRPHEMDVTKMMLFLADAVICNSEAVAHRLGTYPKVHVILNGVDLNAFKIQPPNRELKAKYDCENKRVIGIVSNLSRRRRVEYFIQAAKLIHEQEPNTLFMVVGGEFEADSRGRQKELERYAQRLGLNDCLFFAGAQEDVRPWISLFDVCCHVTKQDACSRAVLEAMAMGRAIVAMNDGGNPELIESGKSGILVAVDKSPAFIREVLKLLRDPVYATMLGDAARTRAEQLFDVKRNCRQTQELYLQCLATR